MFEIEIIKFEAQDVITASYTEDTEDDIIDPSEPGEGGETNPTVPSEPGEGGETDPTDPSEPGEGGETNPTDPSVPGEGGEGGEGGNDKPTSVPTTPLQPACICGNGCIGETPFGNHYVAIGLRCHASTHVCGK